MLYKNRLRICSKRILKTWFSRLILKLMIELLKIYHVLDKKCWLKSTCKSELCIFRSILSIFSKIGFNWEIYDSIVSKSFWNFVQNIRHFICGKRDKISAYQRKNWVLRWDQESHQISFTAFLQLISKKLSKDSSLL